MPVERFLAATNSNDVFVDYVTSARIEPRASVRTCSSAMDVGDPSNLERIDWLYRGELLRSDLSAQAVNDEETIACIADTYARTGYVLDPHTAVAYRASQRDPRDSEGPTVVLATAHPAKFPEIVERAIGKEVSVPEVLAAQMHAEEHMTPIPPDLGALTKALAQWEPT
jgi:threonine synthase